MNTNQKSWLQLYVDAVMEKDPYKRLALVRELRNTPRDLTDDMADEVFSRPAKKSKVSRRH